MFYFQVKNWCFVTYRYFNLSRLPPNFPKKLRNCAWKPIVIEASRCVVSHDLCNLCTYGYTLMCQIKKSTYFEILLNFLFSIHRRS